MTHYIFPGIGWNGIVSQQSRKKADQKKWSRYEQLISLICQHYELTKAELESNSRKRDVADAGKVLCYISNTLLKMSKSEMGRLLNRDHSTIIFRIDTARHLMETDPRFAKLIYSFSEKLIQ